MRVRALLLFLLLAVGATACGDDGPKRVLLVGDSIMSQAAPTVQRRVGDEADVRNESVSGSGLLSPGYVDWTNQLGRLLDRFDPDVVVLLFVGNYDLGTGSTFTTAQGDVIGSRQDPAFFRAWQAQAQRMTDQAEEAGADVVWVLPPPMRDREDQTVVEGLRTVYEDLGTTTIDADDALADDDGGFVADLRLPDGVHLAPAGARQLGDLIADQVS